MITQEYPNEGVLICKGVCVRVCVCEGFESDHSEEGKGAQAMEGGNERREVL